MEDSVFLGKWEKAALGVGAGTIHLTQFYELNGKQYAVGRWIRPTGHRRCGAGAAIRRCRYGKILYELRQVASYRRSLLR